MHEVGEALWHHATAEGNGKLLVLAELKEI
jgi:hypothetical protein